jgi:hypothetical protein
VGGALGALGVRRASEPVDFAREMVVAVFAGSRSSSRDRVEVFSVARANTAISSCAIENTEPQDPRAPLQSRRRPTSYSRSREIGDTSGSLRVLIRRQTDSDG